MTPSPFDKRKPKATHRLRDIAVAEVSVVDRAANRRKFLVIKREGDSDMTDTSTSNDTHPVLLTAQAKALFAESLMKVLQPVLAVSEAVKNADEKEDAGEEMPADLVATLKQAHEDLADFYLTQLKKDAGDVVSSFVQVAKLSIALAEELSVGGELTDEIKNRASDMAKVLKTVAGEPETAPATPEPEKTEPAAPAAPAAPPAEPPKTEPAAKSAADQQIAALTQVVSTLAGKVDALSDIVAKGATNKETALQKQLSGLADGLKAVRARVDKAMGSPPSRGSFDVTPAPPAPASASRKVLPHIFNHPIHDPEPAKA